MDLKYDLETITPNSVANTTGIGRGNVAAISLRNFSIAIDTTIYAKTALIFRQNLELQLEERMHEIHRTQDATIRALASLAET